MATFINKGKGRIRLAIKRPRLKLSNQKATRHDEFLTFHSCSDFIGLI